MHGASREAAAVAGETGNSAPLVGVARSLMSAGDVAELLGVPASWVYEQSRRGRIPTVTLGRYRRYRREAIEAWIAGLELEARERRGNRVAEGERLRTARSLQEKMTRSASTRP